MSENRHIFIRPYRDADFARICEIHDPARKNELALAGLEDAFLPLSVAAGREGLFDYQILIAEYDGIAAGFAAFSPDEIAWLYVDTAYCRRGIGKALLNHALQCRAKSIRSVDAETLENCADVRIEVLSGNLPAIALYSSFGFKIMETLSGQMPGNEQFHVTVHVMGRSDKKESRKNT
ncbi:MAG: GNAT family N-acetyltransferase [Clostridium sp.]|nr:GNAT family N-acetyltransferase [Clostridium sp.]